MLRSMKLKSLNPHISCVLCGGYLVDATTIIECLHSFCRSCIICWLERRSFHCPVCETEIHKTRPFLNIRPDRVLQDIVYKLVPGLYHDEVLRRKQFEEEFEKAEKERRGEVVEQEVNEEENSQKKGADVIDDPVCITLEFHGRKRNRNEKSVFPTRYLRCSSKMPVDLLKKFVTMKFGIPHDTHSVEIVRSDEILSDHLTMKELWRIYGLHTKSFIDLQYIIIDKKIDTQIEELPKLIPVKKIKRRRRRKQNTISSDGTSIPPVKRKRQRRIGRIYKKNGLPLTTDTPMNEQNNGHPDNTPSFTPEPVGPAGQQLPNTAHAQQEIKNDSVSESAIQADKIKIDTYVCPVTPESDTDHTLPSGLLDTKQVDLPTS